MKQPVQGELPLAIVAGEVLTTLPEDLYIPPDALEVILDAFEGPLDLLLYLIRRQNLDIRQINVAEITHQYMAYIAMLEAMRFELAAEYLLMAAMLAEIKSRVLLPRPPDVDAEEEDPRAALIRQLLAYEELKQSAELLDSIPRVERDWVVAQALAPELDLLRPPPTVELAELVVAFSDLLARAQLSAAHQVHFETLSTRERMSQILDHLQTRAELALHELFQVHEGRAGVVVAFLAVLELVREGLISLVQAAPGQLIYVTRDAQHG